MRLQPQTESLYSDVQANEILRTAVRLAAPGEITFQELMQAAAELGISGDELKSAEAKYLENTSEAGQIAEFRRMQRKQIAAGLFDIFVVAAIIGLIAFFDLPKYRLALLGIIVLVAGAVAIYRYRQHADFESEKEQAAFREWQRKKQVWLRPERARDIVHEELNRERSIAERYEAARPRAMLEMRLRERMGYDRKRARTVLDAYLRENPELQARWGL